MVVPGTSFTQTPIDLVIFDCDGVLIDSEVISKRVLLIMLEELGVNVSDDYFDTYFLGHSYESLKATILADYTVALGEEFSAHYQQKLMQAFAEELTPTIQLEWMLSKLKAPYCVGTSSGPERVEFAFNKTGLQRYFCGRIFTASEVENGKPAPDLFLHAASKMGVEPKNCLVIEDSQAGIQAAQAANMQVIHYAGASHLKNKIISHNNAENPIKTIFHWEDLYKFIPALIL